MISVVSPCDEQMRAESVWQSVIYSLKVSAMTSRFLTWINADIDVIITAVLFRCKAKNCAVLVRQRFWENDVMPHSCVPT